MMGEFKTETGCRVKVRPAPEHMAAGTVILSLRVDQPGHVGQISYGDSEPTTVQYAEVALSPLDRVALLAALNGDER